MSKELTFKEIAEHSTKKDLYLIIHDKVYDTSSFVDEHPGGEEVLLDVGGQDATEAFEDVGHSDEAREILDRLIIGTLKRLPGDPGPTTGATDKVSAGPSPSNETGSGITLYAIVLLGAILAYGGYYYMQQNQQK